MTVNLNGLLDYGTGATNSQTRRLFLDSVYGGVVNVNSNIVMNHDIDGANRLMQYEGNGVMNLNGYFLQTNGTLGTLTNRIDGDRSLRVSINNPDTLGAGVAQLYAGSVLQMNYDVFTAQTNGTGGYPGSVLVYGQDYDVNLVFNGPQGGFFDPRWNDAGSGLVVRAFNGIGGDLTGAYFTNTLGQAFSGSGISFQTNAIVAENTINQPTKADFGDILWLGITNAGGVYDGVGDTNATPYRGVSLGAFAPITVAERLSGTNNLEITPILTGFHGDLTATNNDLRILLPNSGGLVTFSPQSATERATLNSGTGNAYFEGPGILNLGNSMGLGWQTIDGTASNLYLFGLFGAGPENPLNLNQQNSEVLRLENANALPTNFTMTVANGQVRFYRSGDVLGYTNAGIESLQSTLIVSNGASIFADDAAATAGNLGINRGKIIFQGDGAVYTGSGGDGWGTLALNVRTNMVFSPESLFIINDNGDTGLRDLNSAGYTFFLTNMNIVIGDDLMRTAIVANTAFAWQLADGKRMINSTNSNGNLNRIFRFSGATTNEVAITAQRNASEVRIAATTGRTFTIGANVATTNAATTILNNYTNRFVTVLDNGTTRAETPQNGAVVLNGVTNLFRDLRLEGGTATINGNRLIANLVESRSGPGVGGTMIISAGLATITNAVSIDGGDFRIGNDAGDNTRIVQDLILRETTIDSASVIMGSGIVEVARNLYADSVSRSNTITGAGFNPQVSIYSDTGIISGNVWIGPTNPGVAGTAILRVNDQDTDLTVVGGDMVLNTAAAGAVGTVVQRGDLVVSNNIVVNPFGLDRRAQTNSPTVTGVNGNANLLQIVGYRDTVTNDGIGLLDRLQDGTMALGSDGIKLNAYGQLLIDLNKTNDYTQLIGQKITIDNGGPFHKEDQAMLWIRATTNAFVGGNGTGTPLVQLTNIWLNEGAHLRIDEEGTAVQAGLVLAGTNTTIGEGPTQAEDFDLLDIVSTVPGSAKTLHIGATNLANDLGFETTLLGTASEDVTLDLLWGTLTVTNGVGNFKNLARAAGVSPQTNALIRLFGAQLDQLSNIAGRVEIGDYAQLLINQVRTNQISFIGNEVRVDNTGSGAYYFGTQSVIQVANVGGTGGTTIYALTNVVMAADSSLRVDVGGSAQAAVGLRLEGNATLSDGVGTTSDDFGLIDVVSSSPGSARTLQLGVSGGGEESFQTILAGVASSDITFDIVNGSMIVTNAGGDVQGSVKVRAGSTFASQNTVEEILNLAGDGVVIGNVLVSNVLAPGLSPGTLTVTGNMQFVATSILDFELSATSTNVGGGINDLLQIVSGSGFNGDLTLDGTLQWTNVATVAGQGWTAGDFWTLIAYEGSLTDFGLDLGTLPTLDDGFMWMLDTTTQLGEVRLSIVIPEPSTWALLAVGSIAVGYLHRRRRRD